MIDFSFIRNRLPENTFVKFRRKHMKGFLHMLHPNLDLDEETITCMMSNAVEHPISDAYYDDKIEEYYTTSGVSLHHILIATQTCCVVIFCPISDYCPRV